MLNKIKQKIKVYGVKYCFYHCIVQLFNHSSWSDWRVKNIVCNKFDYKYLKKHYKKFIEYREETQQEVPKLIWTCWLQGEDKAPELVKACWNSMKKQYPDYKITIITNENIGQYVSFPKHINEKYNHGSISRTHYSDLIRLNLLIKYGGIWIDSTVFCSNNHLIKYLKESDTKFYIFKDLFSLDTTSNISSWLIYSEKDNNYLIEVQKLLYKYWEDNDKLINYFTFHLFFVLVSEVYKDEYKNIPSLDSANPHILQQHLFEQFDERIFAEYLYASDFHKLSYKFGRDKTDLLNTYYKKILERSIKL